MDSLSEQSAYVAEIKVIKVNRLYMFPLLVRKIDGLNLNDDNIKDPITEKVDNIGLEDLIEFQKIRFELIREYCWMEGVITQSKGLSKDSPTNVWYIRSKKTVFRNCTSWLWIHVMAKRSWNQWIMTKNTFMSEFESYWYKIIECSKLNNDDIYDVKIVK